MPNSREIEEEMRPKHKYRSVRLRYLKEWHEITGRSTIVYYSGWLQKPRAHGIELNDLDMYGFMSVISGLERPERDKGLDLILHTPGGSVAATGKLIDYLRGIFGTNIRVIVPHLAMSAGTMIACAAKTILMGKHSGLGPIDPQIRDPRIGVISAHGILQEFARAHEEIKADPTKGYVWQPILEKYPPFLIQKSEDAISWTKEVVVNLLETGMLKGDKTKAEEIAKTLASHSAIKSHERQLSAKFCQDLGLNVEMIERDQKEQDIILSIHHACSLTLMHTPVAKLIMNHNDVNIALRASISAG